MSDTVQDLMAPALPQFPISSRYHDLATATWSDAAGREIAYLRRRFLPMPGALQTIDTHLVAQGERLDQIAALELGDALLSWRIADANGAMQPHALTETIGRRLRIALPAGMSGAMG